MLFPTDYGTQLVLFFKPELALVATILALLVAVAIELGRGRSKTVLSIECWETLGWGLALTATLYSIRLFECPATSSVLLNGYFYTAPGIVAAKLLVTLSGLFVHTSAEQYIREQRRHTLEFAIIMSFAILLLVLLVGANKLIAVFLMIGGFSLCLYILILYDLTSQPSREAATKYFYLSTLSTGLILFGVFQFYIVNKNDQFGELLTFATYELTQDSATLMRGAIVFMVVGFLFKLSAFPAHLWAVDVYEGSPAPVMAFFLLPVKVAVILVFTRILNTAFVGYEEVWLSCLSIATIGSLTWGALAAAQERKLTRFLGYASINQLGFLLLAISVTTDGALGALSVYLILYALMTASFLLVFLHARREDNHNMIYLADLRGLAPRESLLSWNTATALFSMAGVPPLGGFFGKYLILDAALRAGLYTQVIVALATSLISTFYYLQLIKAFWFEEAPATRALRCFLSTGQRTLSASITAILWIAPVFIPVILPRAAALSEYLTTSA
jgi:NADH-quinone oxidoreductase subunit N